MFKRIVTLVVIALFTGISVLATPPENLKSTIDGIITTALSTPQLHSSDIGVAIRSLNDSTTWYTYNATKPFIPASTAKTITASLALEQLTPEYRFKTQVLIDGRVENGILQGSLIIRGSGDPSLVSDDLREIAQSIAMGDAVKGIQPITVINGQILLDDSFFPRKGPLLGVNWEKDDLPWYYAAPSSALSCNRNSITLTVKGTTSGNPAEITLAPETGLFAIQNKTMTAENLVTGNAEVHPDRYQITVTGNVAPGATITEDLSVLNPQRFFMEQFRKGLDAAGITVTGNLMAGDTSHKPTLLLSHESAPLRTIVSTMLKESDNHTAEQLRWTVLALLHTDIPIAHRYNAIMRDFCSKNPQLKQANLQNLVDGSGLSRDNRLSPSSVVDVLTFMTTSPNFQAFYDALPIAGVDGTLYNRCVKTPAEGNARAKTGTMRGVCTLAGYVNTRSGERLVFAIFLNGYSGGAGEARKLQDRIIDYLAMLGTP